MCLCNDGTGLHDTGGNDSAAWGRGCIIQEAVSLGK